MDIHVCVNFIPDTQRGWKVDSKEQLEFIVQNFDNLSLNLQSSSTKFRMTLCEIVFYKLAYLTFI